MIHIWWAETGVTSGDHVIEDMLYLLLVIYVYLPSVCWTGGTEGSVLMVCICAGHVAYCV